MPEVIGLAVKCEACDETGVIILNEAECRRQHPQDRPCDGTCPDCDGTGKRIIPIPDGIAVGGVWYELWVKHEACRGSGIVADPDQGFAHEPQPIECPDPDCANGRVRNPALEWVELCVPHLGLRRSTDPTMSCSAQRLRWSPDHSQCEFRWVAVGVKE